MKGDARNFTVNSYTNDTWTTMVDCQADVDCIIVTNTGEASANASIRLATVAGVSRGTMMSAKAIGAGESYTFEIPGFKVGRGDIVQVKGSAAGLEFIASGEER